MKNISLVIPVHNEQENVISLAEEIGRVFQKAQFKWEVIWVNDFSSDRTAHLLEEFALKSSHHSLINLPWKSGQSAAVLIGINHSQYPLIGTLDGDGQNAPFDLLALKKLLEERDILLAQGVRVDRKDPGLRLFSTELANIVRNSVLGNDLRDVGCAVRVFKKDIVGGLPAFNGWHRFLPVMVSLQHPEKVIEYPVSHRPRTAGTSKYTVGNRMFVGLFDLVGMLWYKKRMIRTGTAGDPRWKNSSIPSV